MGVVAPEFVSFTLDWWLQNDDHPGWDASTSILTMNLTASRLIGAAAGLAPAFLRIGGSRADVIIYHFDQSDEEERKHCFINSNACLTMGRWDDILNFAAKVKARVVFTLNYIGYTETDTVDWDTSKVFKLLNYTATYHSQSGVLYGLELGNEPLHNAKVKNMTRYAESFRALRNMIDTLWDNVPMAFKPKLMGPATTGAGSSFSTCLTAIGQYLDVATYHRYQDDGKDHQLSKKATSPHFFRRSESFDEAANKTSNMLLIQNAQVWVGEGAMAYHSGQDGVTNTFASSFWYAHNLGEMATSKPISHSVFCRQTLTGGHYELLDHQADYEPNPDYWTALLWNSLMGDVALDAKGINCCIPGSDSLLVHAFCARPSAFAKEGDVSVVFINIDKVSSFNVSTDLSDHSSFSGNRSDFLLEPHNNPRLKSKQARLNGNLLLLDKEGKLPSLLPQTKHNFHPIVVPPLSLLFSVLHNVSARACLSHYSSLT